MPLDFRMEKLPIGHVTEAAPKGSTSVKVCSTAFISTEDGQEFIQRLEGFPTELLAQLPKDRRIAPSQVDHILAIIRRDHSVTLYVNELSLLAGVMIGRDINKGEHVFKNDIVDIATIEFDGIAVPDDAGVALVFSIGWRKGFYYDFAPLHPKESIRRAAPFPAIFGQCYSHVLFQERFSILDSEWETLLKAKWFPFAGLKNETLDDMIAHLRAGWNLDDLTPRIAAEVKERLPGFIKGWREHPAFASHLKTLEKAAEHFTNGDYLSAAGLLFPRIEGVLRANHAATGSTAQPNQKNLSTAAVQARSGRPACLLLPHKFEQYLREVYFASFQPGDAQIGVSRNSVGHGVASEEEFNEKAAVIGLLVVQQLLYCFGRPQGSAAQSIAVCPAGGLPPITEQLAGAP